MYKNLAWIAGMLISLAAYALWQTSYGVSAADGGPGEIVTTDFGATLAAFWCLVALGIASLVYWIAQIRHRSSHPLVASAGIALCVLGLPMALLAHVMTNICPWTEHGTVTAPDGSKYVFLDQSFLQGQTMAIGEVVPSSAWNTRYKIMVWNNGDSPRSWASVIRPSGAKDGYGQLYLTRSGLLVGVRQENRAFLAYDLSQDKPYGHAAIEGISPFVLLDNKQQANRRDAERIVDHIREVKKNNLNPAGIPDKKWIEAGKNDPNSEIRSIAAMLSGSYR